MAGGVVRADRRHAEAEVVERPALAHQLVDDRLHVGAVVADEDDDEPLRSAQRVERPDLAPGVGEPEVRGLPAEVDDRRRGGAHRGSSSCNAAMSGRRPERDARRPAAAAPPTAKHVGADLAREPGGEAGRIAGVGHRPAERRRRHVRRRPDRQPAALQRPVELGARGGDREARVGVGERPGRLLDARAARSAAAPRSPPAAAAPRADAEHERPAERGQRVAPARRVAGGLRRRGRRRAAAPVRPRRAADRPQPRRRPRAAGCARSRPRARRGCGRASRAARRPAPPAGRRGTRAATRSASVSSRLIRSAAISSSIASVIVS